MDVASAASHIDAKWQAASDELARLLARHAAALAETAADYRRIEDTAEEAAQKFFGGIG